MDTRQKIVSALTVILTGLISLMLIAGGNIQDFLDAAETAVSTYDGYTRQTVTYVASDLPLLTEAVPNVETFIPPTRETVVFPTIVATSFPKETPTPILPQGCFVRLQDGRDYVNVRNGATTFAPVVGKLLSGELAIYLDYNETQNWYQVKLSDGTIGWVAAWLTIKLCGETNEEIARYLAGYYYTTWSYESYVAERKPIFWWYGSE